MKTHFNQEHFSFGRNSRRSPPGGSTAKGGQRHFLRWPRSQVQSSRSPVPARKETRTTRGDHSPQPCTSPSTLDKPLHVTGQQVSLQTALTSSALRFGVCKDSMNRSSLKNQGSRHFAISEHGFTNPTIICKTILPFTEMLGEKSVRIAHQHLDTYLLHPQGHGYTSHTLLLLEGSLSAVCCVRKPHMNFPLLSWTLTNTRSTAAWEGPVPHPKEMVSSPEHSREHPRDELQNREQTPPAHRHRQPRLLIQGPI